MNITPLTSAMSTEEIINEQVTYTPMFNGPFSSAQQVQVKLKRISNLIFLDIFRNSKMSSKTN